MIINVSVPLKKNEVKALLLESENPKFELKKEIGAKLTFEVTDLDGSNGDLVKKTKQIITSQEWGKCLAMSILPEGKLYSGQ